MVLMDDNFATVVRAASWGRTVNENIRKFLQFQLTVNISGVLLPGLALATMIITGTGRLPGILSVGRLTHARGEASTVARSPPATLIGSALSEDNVEPLTPVQLLWLNLAVAPVGSD